MATTLMVGQSYHFTVAGSDGSTIPAGTLTAVPDAPTVNITVNPDNSGTVTAVLASVANTHITYSAPGYTSSSETVLVIDRPSIVVTDGPITG